MICNIRLCNDVYKLPKYNTSDNFVICMRIGPHDGCFLLGCESVQWIEPVRLSCFSIVLAELLCASRVILWCLANCLFSRI